MHLIGLLLGPVRQRGSRMFHAPTAVFLPPTNRMVEPDLLVLLPDGSSITSQRGVEGAPDLGIEILSPSNPEHDLLRKREWYGEAGVREYWIVDPEGETIRVLVLGEYGFRTHSFPHGDVGVTSVVLSDLSCRAAEAFA